MLIIPKKPKYRKAFKGGRRKGYGKVMAHTSPDATGLVIGSVGVKSQEGGRRTARQMEAGRRLRRNKLNRMGKVWVSVFTDVPVSKKPREVRIGKGKGNVAYWACHVRPGTLRYEVDGVDMDKVARVLEKVGKKLPVKCRVVRRNRTLC